MVKENERGFLLLELMVALAVLLVMLVPVLGLLTMAAETQARASRHTAAAFLARESMETVRSRGYYQVASVAAETLRRGGGEFLRAVDAAPVMRGAISLKKIVVTVSWQERDSRQEIELVTYLAGGETMGRRGLR